MWSSPTQPFGAANILGNEEKEKEVLSYIGAWNFDRIYTSVGNLPLTNPTTIARWNSSLSEYGLESQMLLGENTWIFPNVRPNLLALLQTRLIDFNSSRTKPTERFAGLHLDIEPQALPNWQNGAADKKELLFLLRDTYADVREFLHSSGAAEVKLYADLPVWFDSSDAIGWTSATERDEWFADIGASLDGISLMAFERSTLNSIISGVNWEVQNFNGEVRVGLNASEIGPGNTFANFASYDSLAAAIANHYGDAIGGIDHQPFYNFAAIAPTPTFSADFDGNGVVDGADFLLWQRGNGTAYGATTGDGDADGSGSVGRFDLQIWREQFGAASPSYAVVPEPNPLSLVLCGISALLFGVDWRRAT